MLATGAAKRRVFGAVLGALLILPLLPATADSKERWAALSVLGDRMNLVYARMETGTRNNPNFVQAIPMKDDVLDRLALRAVLDATVPDAPEIVPLALRDPRYYQVQERLLEGEGKPLLDGLLKALETQQVTHVLLLVRSRGEAWFSVRDGHIGTGMVEGLGFYVDRSTRIQREDTGETDRGYLAPFAYYRLILFDVARRATVGEARVAASRMYLVAGSRESDPWDVVSAKQKVDDIERLLNQHTGDALNRLTASRVRG
jgi:hypothetical protein